MKRFTFITLSLLAGLALLSSCKKDEPVKPEGTVELYPEDQTPDFCTCALTYRITSNCDWTITVYDEEYLMIEPLEGTAGTTDITVIAPHNLTQEPQESHFTVNFVNEAGTVKYDVDIVQPEPSVQVGGLRYPVAYLADGKYWMTQNLRYVPEGKTVSKDLEDIDNGVWYPVTTDGNTASFDESVEGVIEKGYLYTAEVAFGAAITKDNYDKFAKVQGICPEGWHIPDFDDWFGLVGKANGKDSDKTAPYFDETLGTANNPGSGSMAKAAADGMPIPVTGMVNVGNASATKGSLSGTKGKAPDMTLNSGYILGSTAYKLFTNTDEEESLKNVQYYSLMSNLSNNGTIALSYSGYRFGVSVRCVKD